MGIDNGVKAIVTALATALAAACGGPDFEGRYAGREGQTLFESVTLLPDGKAEVVFIGAPTQTSYVIEDERVLMTMPDGERAAFSLDDNGCLTNLIAGTYCKDSRAASTASAASGGSSSRGAEIYEASTSQGKITIELRSGGVAQMTMTPFAPGGGMPQRMSFDVNYERDGDGMTIGLPGEEPMQLTPSGRDFVATMNGETARFVRQ